MIEQEAQKSESPIPYRAVGCLELHPNRVQLNLTDYVVYRGLTLADVLLQRTNKNSFQNTEAIGFVKCGVHGTCKSYSNEINNPVSSLWGSSVRFLDQLDGAT